MGRYNGKIKVVGPRLHCFPADPKTLAPLGCAYYDPWAWIDPEDGPLELIGFNDWQSRRQELLLKNATANDSR